MSRRPRRVGIIEVSSSLALTEEASQALGPSILPVFARIRLPGFEVSAAAIRGMLATDALETAVLQLADARVEVIMFGCTSACFVDGPDANAAITARMVAVSGVRCSTTATAVSVALTHMGVNKLALGTPYPSEVNDAEREWLTSLGYDVVSLVGLGLGSDLEIGSLHPHEVVALARRSANASAEALFLSCTNVRTIDLLPRLSRELGVPVLSSNSATFSNLRQLVRC